MIDEHEITRKAYEQKTEIIETANEMSREISKGIPKERIRKYGFAFEGKNVLIG